MISSNDVILYQIIDKSLNDFSNDNKFLFLRNSLTSVEKNKKLFESQTNIFYTNKIHIKL